MLRCVLVTAFVLGLFISHSHAESSVDASDVRPGGPTVLPPAGNIDDKSFSFDEPPSNAESFTFQAEVNRLMDIIINSLYSNRDIFIRELISNAADALDKIRFLALTKSAGGDGSVVESADDKLEIKVRADKAAGVLQITDTGIGMTRDELIKNLGTIAKSGTSSFLDRLGAAAKEAALKSDASGASNLIGQFGVGFYSAYLVANKVRVESRVDGDSVHVWESGANENFVVFEGSKDGFEDRGTRITLMLKDDAKEYLEEDKLKTLIQKYSQFINFPIFLLTSKEVDVPLDSSSDDGNEKDVSTDSESFEQESADIKSDSDPGELGEEEEEEGIKVDDADDVDDKSSSAESQTRKETRSSWTLINENKPIWTRNAATITEAEYQSFYEGIAKMPGTPIARSHFKGEGEVEFRSILYIPDKAPVGLYGGDAEYEKDAIRLYVRRVLVTDKFEEGLLPRYLAFLVGIVDSDDLPINVSREMLQKSKTLEIIKRKLVRKALEMMRSLVKQDEEAVKSDKPDDDEDDKKEEKESESENSTSDDTRKSGKVRPFLKFWNIYGKSIKLGVIEDSANRARLAKLLRFRSSKSKLDDPNDWVSLDQYLDRMKEDQEFIYYHSDESVSAIEKSPFIEKLIKKGYEVLYLTEPIDEHMIMQLPDYEGSKFMSVAKDNFKFGEKDQKEEKSKTNAWKKSYKPLTKFLKNHLVDKVSKVKLSSRLSDTPCVLSTEQWGYSARMEIIMKAQAFANPDSFQYMTPKAKIMELNPHHPIIKRMLMLVKDIDGKEGDDAVAAEEKAAEFGNLVYDTALISSGYLMQDSTDYAKRMYKWIATSVGVDPNAPVIEEVPEPETDEDGDVKDDPLHDIDLDDLNLKFDTSKIDKEDSSEMSDSLKDVDAQGSTVDTDATGHDEL